MLAELEKPLVAGGKIARLERANSLGLNPGSASLDQQIRTKAHDWAEVRPEWASLHIPQKCVI